MARRPDLPAGLPARRRHFLGNGTIGICITRRCKSCKARQPLGPVPPDQRETGGQPAPGPACPRRQARPAGRQGAQPALVAKPAQPGVKGPGGG